MDLRYRRNRDTGYPCLLTIDMLTRFTAARFPANADRQSIIEDFLA